MSMNQLNGTIPSEIGTLTKLTDLYEPSDNYVFIADVYHRRMQKNQLNGTIPLSFSKLTHLSDLYETLQDVIQSK